MQEVHGEWHKNTNLCSVQDFLSPCIIFIMHIFHECLGNHIYIYTLIHTHISKFLVPTKINSCLNFPWTFWIPIILSSNYGGYFSFVISPSWRKPTCISGQKANERRFVEQLRILSITASLLRASCGHIAKSFGSPCWVQFACSSHKNISSHRM